MTEQEKNIIDIVKRSTPSVFSIVISENEKITVDKDPQKKVIGGGSGFLISGDGLALTNRHVIADAKEEYTAELPDGRKFPINIIAKDQINDIAILKIEGNDLPHLNLGNSKNLQLGQTVITIGNALSQFHNSVSAGIISGLLRVISTEGDKDHDAQNLRGLIQTDAAINPGNSGGPMLDTDGNVIGINAVVVQGASNISFAIPISGAEKDIEDFKKFGKIEQPSLGVRYVVINDAIKEKYKLPINYGAWVIKEHLPHDLAVQRGSSAEKAGIKEGDIILEFKGIKIADGVGLDQLVQESKIGEGVKIKILRNGSEKMVFAVLKERA